MFDYQATIDALTQWGGFLRNHVPVERWPNPDLCAGVAVLAGLVLAFWGARLLRSIYVLSFTIIGGAVGTLLADTSQVDLLIGLSLGAGLGALLAYVLFRWWVGLTTGTVAVLILILAGSPRLNQEFIAYNDFRQGVGTDDWSRTLQPQAPQQLDGWAQASAFFKGFAEYVQLERYDAFIRTAVALGLVWLLGTAAGLLLPRATMVIGTALLGMLLLAGGVSVLLNTRWPQAWAAVVENRSWFLAGWVILLLAALSYQARFRRPQVISAVPAAAPRPV